MTDVVSAEEWATWEGEREAANAAYAAERHSREVRNRTALIAALREEIESLTAREFFARECLVTALQLAEEQREKVAFLEDLLAAVFAEQDTSNVIDLPRAA